MSLFESEETKKKKQSPDAPEPASEPASEPAEPKGLNQVYPDPVQTTEDEEQEIDIVAIYGLNAESSKTWLAWKIDSNPDSGKFHWLKDVDMLPSVIPNARIFTYNWDMSPGRGAATDILLGHADTLLHRLHIKRDMDQNANRPIIWVASCFGGLMLAKALQRASEGNSEYQGLLNSTIGAAFLGTPFRGSHNAFYSSADLRLAIALSQGVEANGELLKYLLDETTRSGRGELDGVVQRFTQMIVHNTARSKSVAIPWRDPKIAVLEEQNIEFLNISRELIN